MPAPLFDLRQIEISKHDKMAKASALAEFPIVQDVCRVFPEFKEMTILDAFQCRSMIAEKKEPDEYQKKFCSILIDDHSLETLPLDMPSVRIRISLDLNLSWASRILSQRKVPSLLSDSQDRVFPVGSIVRRRGVKELQFLHIYRKGDIVVAPLYGAIVGSFSGVFLVDNRHPENSVYLCSGRKFFLNADLMKIFTFLEKLPPETQDKTMPCVAVVVGAMTNNYGHTVLNHCSAIAALKDKEIYEEISKIYIGDDDFLEFSNLLPNDKKISSLADYYDAELGAYVVPEVILPITTKLPVRSSLQYIIDRAIHNQDVEPEGHVAAREVKSPLAQRKKIPSIVFTLDARKGKRKCKNAMDLLLESVNCFRESFACFKIILDGHTAKPVFGNARIAADDSRAFNFEQVKGVLLDHGISDEDIVCLDGLRLSQKIRVCESFDIRLCVAPLGSSLMFPIYFLNAPILGYGESRFVGLMREGWAWHVDPGCHADRFLPLLIAPPSDGNADGYSVDLAAARTLVKDNIREDAPMCMKTHSCAPCH